jgi:hypothetical protein
LTASAITFTGQDALGRKADEILAMAARAADTAPAWRAWGDDVEHAFREQFDSQGVRLTGEVWAPLSPRYAAWKARHFPGMPILRRTDVLFASMTHRPMAVERVTGHSGEYGTDVRSRRGAPYPKFHQHGTRFMPARPLVRTTPDLVAAAARHLRQHILHGLT